MKHIFDKDFDYVPSNKTDVRATFERVRREQEKSKCERDHKICGEIKPRVKGKNNG